MQAMLRKQWRTYALLTLACHVYLSRCERPTHETQAVEPGDGSNQDDAATTADTGVTSNGTKPNPREMKEIDVPVPTKATMLRRQDQVVSWIGAKPLLDDNDNVACFEVDSHGKAKKQNNIQKDIRDAKDSLAEKTGTANDDVDWFFSNTLKLPNFLNPSWWTKWLGQTFINFSGMIGVLGLIGLIWWFRSQYLKIQAIVEENMRVEQALADRGALLAKFDNKQMRQDMNEIQRRLSAAVLCKDIEGLRVTPDESIRLFSEYKEEHKGVMSEEEILSSWEQECISPEEAAENALEELKAMAADMKKAMDIGDWVLNRRQQLDTDGDTSVRMALLDQTFIMSGTREPAVQMDLGPFSSSTSEEKYVAYCHVKAHWARPVTEGVLLDILHSINGASSVYDEELVSNMGGCSIEPDFDDVNLKLYERDSHLYNGKRLALKVAGVKDGKRVLPKAEEFLKNPILSERPASRYNGDWNRAMAIAKDPVVLRVFFELLQHHSKVKIKRINNKLFSSTRDDPEIGQYCTHILILYGIQVWDQIRCIEVEHVAEVQLILHDFYVVDAAQHKIYEVERTMHPEDIATFPIFPIIQVDEAFCAQKSMHAGSARCKKRRAKALPLTRGGSKPV